MAVYRLLRDELEYELEVRGVTGIPTVELMRKRLRQFLKLEKEGKSGNYPPIGRDAQDELKICSDKLTDIENLLQVVNNDSTSSDIEKIEVKLDHVFERIKRVSGDATASVARSTLLTKGLDYYETLEISRQQIGRENPPNVQTENAAPVISMKKTKIPVCKWDISFNGDSRGISVNAFIERVEELRIARQISQEELWDSAIDLFKGSAMIWFRAIRREVHNWDELLTSLREEFQPPDYEEQLWNEIRLRTQGPDERIGLYLATMENLFARVPGVVKEAEKLKVLRRNIDPYFIDRLALQKIDTIHELLEVCRQLEQGKFMVDRFQRPITTKKTQPLEPDLAYYTSKCHISTVETTNTTSREIGKSSQVEQRTIVQGKPRKSECWNCKKIGHGFRSCREPPSRFCFKCGFADVYIATCPRCNQQGNGQG